VKLGNKSDLKMVSVYKRIVQYTGRDITLSFKDSVFMARTSTLYSSQ